MNVPFVNVRFSRSIPRTTFTSNGLNNVRNTKNKLRVQRTFFICRAEQGNDKSDENTEKEIPPKIDGDDSKPETISESSQQEPTGSTLPGISVVPVWKRQEPPPGGPAIPKSDIETLRNQVFGFDTFFVTGQEPYQTGILFKGNLRGEPEAAFEKLSARIEERFSGAYQLFFLKDPAETRPVAIVLPAESLTPSPSSVPSWLAATAFGVTTLLSLWLRSSGYADLDGLPSVDDLLEAVPSVLVFLSVLGAHEIGHIVAARRAGLQLGPPFFIPGLQLGSFGAITPFRSLVKSRQQLAEVATAGPLAGAVVAITLLVVGLLLPPGEEGVVVQASAFHDSILVGLLSKLTFGDALTESSSVTLNPLVLDAWAALLINSINLIPVGELDGGRIANSVWGRQSASAISAVSLVLLGLCGLFSDVALYWVALVVFLQRGPVLPQANEITPPTQGQVALSLGVLVLGLLVYSPLLLPFSS